MTDANTMTAKKTIGPEDCEAEVTLVVRPGHKTASRHGLALIRRAQTDAYLASLGAFRSG